MKNLSSLRMNGLRSLNDDMLRSIIGGLQRPADDPRSGPVFWGKIIEEVEVRGFYSKDGNFSYYTPVMTFQEQIGDGGWTTLINQPNNNSQFLDKNLYSAGSPDPTSSVLSSPPENNKIPNIAELASAILTNANIILADNHQIGITDNANAFQNITDTSKGLQAQTSNYENAPGTMVPISEELLTGVLQLAATFKIKISEIAGGSHGATSPHYGGNCLDITSINEVKVIYMTKEEVERFRKAAFDAGAVEVYDPFHGEGHGNHFHIQW